MFEIYGCLHVEKNKYNIIKPPIDDNVLSTFFDLDNIDLTDDVKP